MICRSIIFLLLCCITCFAQNGYVPGYVITNTGDTLKGKLKDRKFVNEVESWQKVNFTDTLGRKYKFTPEELIEYGRKGRKKYRVLTLGVESKKTFVEVSEEGSVILYSYYRGGWGSAGNAISLDSNKKESKARTAFYIGVQGIPIMMRGATEHAECFLQFSNKPNSLMQWRPRDYQTTAKVFFSDNAEIIKLLEDGELDERDIYAIVRKYNEAKK